MSAADLHSHVQLRPSQGLETVVKIYSSYNNKTFFPTSLENSQNAVSCGIPFLI